jgi:hypothetical protein
MIDALEGHDVEELLRAQAGVATLRQLTDCGMTMHAVQAQVDARRWQRFGSHCVVAHNWEPTRAQWMWIAVLDNPGPAALAGLTSLEIAGFRYFGTETKLIHVIVQRGANYHRFPDVKVHESRRFGREDVVVSHGFPHTAFPRSALNAAAWQPHPRYACGLLAATVQQRICTAAELSDALRYVGRIRHKQRMRLTLHDVAGGAEALSELDVAALCRRFDLLPPRRQVYRCDPSGLRRWLDCEWHLPDGTVAVLEVDGSQHMSVEHWGADKRRDRKETIRGRKVLRCTAYEARWEQHDLAGDLLAIGVPRLVSPLDGYSRAEG